MQSELHGNVVYLGTVNTVTVACFCAFLLAYPKSLLFLKDYLYTSIMVLCSMLYSLAG